MAMNFVQKGNVIEVTAALARTSGQLVKEQDYIGIVADNAEAGEKYSLYITGVWNVSVDTLSVSKGDYLYFNSSNVTKDKKDTLFAKAVCDKKTDNTVDVLLLPPTIGVERTLIVTATADHSAGDVVKEDSFIGIASENVTSGNDFSVYLTGIHTIAVPSALEVSKGDLLYRADAGTITKTDTDTLFAKAVADKDASDNVQVILLPQQA